MKKMKILDFTGFTAKSLLYLLLCIFTYNSYSLTVNSNDVVVCSGSTGVYSLTATSPNVIYSWTIYKFNTLIQTNVNTIMYMPNNQAYIQWLVAGEYTISVSGNGQTATYDVLVLQSPNPYITSNSIVGCQQGMRKDQDDYGSQIVDDANGCVNVCEFSSVNYTAHGQSGSYFVWSVTGGTFSNGLTTISGTSMPYNPMSNVTVNWGLQGPCQISVTEYTNYIVNCPSTTKTVCLNLIEKPIATFSMDSEPPDYPSDYCYDVCLNQVVNFIDYSTASVFSPIVSWEWDFGDNTYSQLQNPTHQYTSSGNYTVTLTVTNKCNCKTTYTILFA